jgi:hypothetical protein
MTAVLVAQKALAVVALGRQGKLGHWETMAVAQACRAKYVA